MNMQMREMRRLDMARRNQEMESRMSERRVLSDYQRGQRQLIEQNRRLSANSQNEIRRLIENQRQLQRRNQQMSEQKQRQILRNIERIRKRQYVPMINGREVSSGEQLWQKKADVLSETKPITHSQKVLIMSNIAKPVIWTQANTKLYPVKPVHPLFVSHPILKLSRANQKSLFNGPKPIFPKPKLMKKVVVI